MQQNAVINAAHVAAVVAAAATNPPGPAPAPPNLVPIPAPLPTPKISNDVRKMWFRNAVQRGYEGLDFVFQNAELQPNMHIDDLMSICRNIMIRNRQKNKLINNSSYVEVEEANFVKGKWMTNKRNFNNDSQTKHSPPVKKQGNNPHYGKQCNYCGKLNHIENQCWIKNNDLKL